MGEAGRSNGKGHHHPQSVVQEPKDQIWEAEEDAIRIRTPGHHREGQVDPGQL